MANSVEEIATNEAMKKSHEDTFASDGMDELFDSLKDAVIHRFPELKQGSKHYHVVFIQAYLVNRLANWMGQDMTEDFSELVWKRIAHKMEETV